MLNSLDVIQAVIMTIFFVAILGLPVYFICRMCDSVIKICDSAQRSIKKDSCTKSNGAIKGIVALIGGYWALKAARVAKTERERSFYMSLAEEAQELAHEANTEMEGHKAGTGKFYDDPDYWKKDTGDDQDPPTNSRWKS